MANVSSFKARAASGRGSAFEKYRALYYGDRSLAYVLKAELLNFFISGLPGAPGLLLRKLLFPSLFKSCGRGTVFGRNITLRHAHKISLGDHVIVDDGVVLDAKGENNAGIDIGSGVYIGRNTIIYCKNGAIAIDDRVNISSNVQIFSSHQLTIGHDTVIAAFTYLLSGGMYDYNDPTPFAGQSGTNTRGPTLVGPDCWIGAHVVVVDGSTIGERCVIGAGAVVTGEVPARSLALGIPARTKPLEG